MSYSIPAPFMPLEFKRKEISQFNIGVIYAFYSIGRILCGVIFSPKVTKYGRRNSMLIGNLIVGLSYVGFGL
jgi:MFS family permease